MAEDIKESLRDAIARNTPVVLSLPSAGMLRHNKTRFLAETPDGVWIESIPAEHSLIDSLIQSQETVGVTFKTGVNKVGFTSIVLRRETAYKVNAELTLEAVLLRLPDNIRSVQRRNNYRVRITEIDDILIRVWRITERAVLRDKPNRTAEVTTRILDLSVGGAGVIFIGKDNEPPKISQEDRLRVMLSFHGDELLLEGHMRPAKAVDRTAHQFSAGIAFIGLENGIDGRQILNELNKIVGELQREEVRRNRLRAG